MILEQLPDVRQWPIAMKLQLASELWDEVLAHQEDPRVAQMDEAAVSLGLVPNLDAVRGFVDFFLCISLHPQEPSSFRAMKTRASDLDKATLQVLWEKPGKDSLALQPIATHAASTKAQRSHLLQCGMSFPL